VHARPHIRPRGRDIRDQAVGGPFDDDVAAGVIGPAFDPVDVIAIERDTTQSERRPRDSLGRYW
jgi:hypothetical protein